MVHKYDGIGQIKPLFDFLPRAKSVDYPRTLRKYGRVLSGKLTPRHELPTRTPLDFINGEIRQLPRMTQLSTKGKLATGGIPNNRDPGRTNTPLY